MKKVISAQRNTGSAFVRQELGGELRGKSNGETALAYFTSRVTEGRLYLLDEPENSLSADYQQALARFLEDSARFYRCQLVISTHSPFLLALTGAAVYNLDAQPPCRRPWRELPAMQTWAAFFRAHQGEWEDDKEENHETR